MLKKFLVAVLSAGLIFSVSPENIFNVAVAAEVTQNYSLDFDASKGVEKTMAINGIAVKFVAYENIVYVKNPANVESQTLSIYIPAEYLKGGTVNGYTAPTAPIFMPNGVGGYMPGGILPPVEKDKFTGKPNASLVALSRGLVVVSLMSVKLLRLSSIIKRQFVIFVTIKIVYLRAIPKKLFPTALQRAVHYRRRWEVWVMRLNLTAI